MKNLKTKIDGAITRVYKWLCLQGVALTLNLYSQFTYDKDLSLKAAALVAATANGSLVLDLGTGLVMGHVVVDCTALEVATGDESYHIIVQGSSDVGFGTAGNIRMLGSIVVGAAAATLPTSVGVGASSTPGRYVIPIRNEVNGVTCRYMRLRTVVAGTIATGINYSAFLAKA